MNAIKQYLRHCPYLSPFHLHVMICDENGTGTATPEVGETLGL
jgi:hypothetical protein